jgi:hypothetical protein
MITEEVIKSFNDAIVLNFTKGPNSTAGMNSEVISH